MTIEAAAKHFGVTTRTIDRWAKLHGLPVHRATNGPKSRKFYFIAELNEWMARNRWSGVAAGERA